MKKAYCERLTALAAEQVFILFPSINSHDSVAYRYLRMDSQDLDECVFTSGFLKLIGIG